ncbi:hypothetical protein N431DRAFT_350708 [Stipitochalara longipes BDJ]|nr:hypothetical protein N431DRAFT_350708 [Stipitochalara longipes BDJ]
MCKTRPGQPIPLTTLLSDEETSDLLTVTGHFGGIISTIGPSYEAIVGIPDATRSWKVVLSKCKSNQENLRKKNEGFMRVLLELDNTDLDKIHPIDPQFSWRCSSDMAQKMRPSEDELAWQVREKDPKFRFGPQSEDLEHGTSQSPRLFATIDGKVGLVPHTARLGDLLVQFYQSDVVAVVRLYDDFQMRIVGRAVIANDDYIESSKFLAQSELFPSKDSIRGDLLVDIRTLQLLAQ